MAKSKGEPRTEPRDTTQPPVSEPMNVTQVTAEQRAAPPVLPPTEPVTARMSDGEVQSNMAVRCPACRGIGELVENLTLRKYAARCRTHGRFTRWYARNVDVLTAPVVSRARLKALGE